MKIFNRSNDSTDSNNPQSQTQSQSQPRRRGCLHGCLVALLIYFGLSFIFGLLLGNRFESQPVKLTDYSVYKLELSGALVEQGMKSNPFSDLISTLPQYNRMATTGLDQILANIQLAETDDHIKGIYLYDGSMQMSPASAKAIRDRLLLFKQRTGKWVIAYSSHYNATNYYVATAADRIMLTPTGNLSWHGTLAQKMYYTRLLEKIGVEMQILKVGTYKSAVEPYFRTSMSDADKHQTMLYLTGIWDEYKQAVSNARNISVDLLDQYADEYIDILPAETYVAYNMIDTLVYREDMEQVLRTMTGTKDFKLLSTSKLSQVQRPAGKVKDRVAVIYAQGTIVGDDGDGITTKQMLKQVKEICKDENVKAVVLRVNSPGGSADASEQIWHGVKTLQQKGLPVVVSMGDLAASGGYYISCGANYIFAEPTTLTGSIGIFGVIPNVSKLRDKIGIDMDGVGTNKHSAMEITMLSQGMTHEEQAMMQRMIEHGYDLFTRRCAEGRHMSQDDIKAIAEGRVWLGKDALQIGLVDELGNIDNAIAKAAEMAGIDSYSINYYPEQLDPLEEIMKALGEMPDEEEQLLARIRTFVKEPRILMLMEPVEIK